MISINNTARNTCDDLPSRSAKKSENGDDADIKETLDRLIDFWLGAMGAAGVQKIEPPNKKKKVGQGSKENMGEGGIFWSEFSVPTPSIEALVERLSTPDETRVMKYVASRRHINKRRTDDGRRRAECLKWLEDSVLRPLYFLLEQLPENDIETRKGGKRNQGTVSRRDPWVYFQSGLATAPLKWSARWKFWTPAGSSKMHVPWLLRRQGADSPKFEQDCILGATAHFAQPACGTAVHIGDGIVLTAAHVVTTIDDEEEENDGDVDDGVGTYNGCRDFEHPRYKVLAFPNRAIYLARCVAANEKDDVAMLRLVHHIKVRNNETLSAPCSSSENGGVTMLPPKVDLAQSEPNLNDSVVCVGNPCNLDLETTTSGKELGVVPKVWHVSLGQWKGRQGESEEVSLGKIKHTCWTYWGHSGAPLFNESRELIGLHNTWDSLTGMRHGCDLESLLRMVASS